MNIQEPVILISVSKTYEPNISSEKLYEITRGDWVIGERRNKATYAFSVYKGIVQEVYRIHNWFPVTTTVKEQKIHKRWRFEGEVSKEMQHYVGSSVERYRKAGEQNPIKYINC